MRRLVHAIGLVSFVALTSCELIVGLTDVPDATAPDGSKDASTEAGPCAACLYGDTCAGTCVFVEATCEAGTCVDTACTTAGSGKFSVTQDIVVDRRTQHHGLLWQRTCSNQNGTFATATQKCAALSLESIDAGWRLPTAPELASITLDGGCLPSTDQAAFPNTPAGIFWTTSDAGSSGDASLVYGIDFSNAGAQQSIPVASPFYARCAHDPP